MRVGISIGLVPVGKYTVFLRVLGLLGVYTLTSNFSPVILLKEGDNFAAEIGLHNIFFSFNSCTFNVEFC